MKIVTTKEEFRPYEVQPAEEEVDELLVRNDDAVIDNAVITEEAPVDTPETSVSSNTAHNPTDSASVDIPAAPESPVETAPIADEAQTDSTATVNTKVADTFSNSKAKQEASESKKAAATEKSAQKKKAEPSTKKSTPRTHTVRKGESLYKIAQKHGMTVKELQRINGIDGSKIKPGDKIKLK